MQENWDNPVLASSWKTQGVGELLEHIYEHWFSSHQGVNYQTESIILCFSLPSRSLEIKLQAYINLIVILIQVFTYIVNSSL